MIPPHHVMGGTVPAPTQVYGLTLIKDFETRPPTTTETIVVSRGTLAIGAAIHGIPCGPGIFWDDRDGQWFGPYDRHARPLHFQKPDSVSCTLSAEVPVLRVVLRQGEGAWINLPADPHQREFGGTLVADATLHEIPCAPGAAYYRVWMIRCALSRDQTLHGFSFAAGREVEVIQYPTLKALDDIQRFRGTLTQAAEVFGMIAPIGSELSVTLSPDPNSASGKYQVMEFAAFILPKGAELTLHGATLRGPIEIQYTARKEALEIFPGKPGWLGFLSFEGKRHQTPKNFSGTDWTARFEGGRWMFSDEVNLVTTETVIDDHGDVQERPIEPDPADDNQRNPD